MDYSCHPSPHIDVLARNCLRLLCANVVRLGVERTLIGAPALGVKPCDATRLHEGLPRQQDGILASPNHIRQYGATLVRNRLP
jgi:hypothetical protein